MNATEDIVVGNRLSHIVITVLMDAYGHSLSFDNLLDLSHTRDALDVHVKNQLALDSLGDVDAFGSFDAYVSPSAVLPNVEEFFVKARTIRDWVEAFEAFLKARVFNTLCEWMERRYVESRTSDRLWSIPSKHHVESERELQIIGHLDWALKDLESMHHAILQCLHISEPIDFKPLGKETTIEQWADSFVELLLY